MLGEGCCGAAAPPKKELEGMGEGPLGDGAPPGCPPHLDTKSLPPPPAPPEAVFCILA